MEQKDTKAVQELINTYLKQFNLAPVMDEEEVAHWFLPRDHIIDTYVVEVKYAERYINVSECHSVVRALCTQSAILVHISIKFLKCRQCEICVL